MMSILDAVGITRLETIVPKEKVFVFPMAHKANTAHLDEQLEAIRNHLGLVHTSLCHLSPASFPLGHKGKIIFIERDARAVAVSAFHFFKKLDHMIPYMKKHGPGIKNHPIFFPSNIDFYLKSGLF